MMAIGTPDSISKTKAAAASTSDMLAVCSGCTAYLAYIDRRSFDRVLYRVQHGDHLAWLAPGSVIECAQCRSYCYLDAPAPVDDPHG